MNPKQVADYLGEIELLRKTSTLREATRICHAALPHLLKDDPRRGVLAYLMERKRMGIEPRTLENERIRLTALYRSTGMRLNIPKFKFVIRDPEVYSDEELERIFTAANGRDLWLYKTLLMSGLRKQEAMYLQYDDLLDAGISVRPHGSWVPKDYEQRIIRVPRSLIDTLRALPPVFNSQLVFPTQCGTVNHHMLRSLKRCAKRAGVDPEKAWLHKMRANFATKLLRAGLPLPDVMKQLGHATLKSTLRYLALLGGTDIQAKIESIWGLTA